MKLMAKFIPLKFKNSSPPEMIRKSEEFFEELAQRRTVRFFSDKSIPEEVIINSIKAAGRAPSGANFQPWFFAVVKDQAIKSRIRLAAEKEERAFYNNVAPPEWIKALEPFGTNSEKPFLENAPYLIVVFERKYSIDKNNHIVKHYYTKESVGIATGVLLTALHHSGLATLTHTPSPMNFLSEILNRPPNEKPFLLLVCGYPAENCTVPDIKKKNIDEIMTIY